MVQPSFSPKGRKIRFVNLCFISAALMVLKGAAVLLVLNALLIAQSEQRTFASPEDASRALFAAVQTGDRTAMLDIFGPGGNDVISMGDAIEDHSTRDQFVAKYREMHRLSEEPNGKITLYIGAENWALPVPLVAESGAWHFDTDAGKTEILLRRIDDNEYAVIEVCHALANAQGGYYSQSGDGKGQKYAKALASADTQHNGPFWTNVDDEAGRPIEPLAASSGSAVYGARQGKEKLHFHGYYFRVLTRQGTSASGGARSYLVDGQMTSGFAIVAYPAEYHASGVMTFIVNQAGDVYQKDLGTETERVATAMKEYDPDETWEMSD